MELITKIDVTQNASQARWRVDRRWPGLWVAMALSTASTKAHTNGKGFPITIVVPMGLSDPRSQRDLSPVFHLTSKGRDIVYWKDGSWPVGQPRKEVAQAPSELERSTQLPPP